MIMKHGLARVSLLLLVLVWVEVGLSQEDQVVKTAIETFRRQVRLPSGTEIKFLEKKESPVADFYAVKLLISLPDKEVPTVIYVDRAGERVFIGNLFIKGENVTTKDAGPPRPKKIDMATLEMERSPFLGPMSAKVTIVEFANFQCPYCMDSWNKLKNVLARHPKEIRYFFKHFPFQASGKTFELSEMAAAAQEVSQEAFWLIHDHLFTPEGQNLARLDRKGIQKKCEQLLKAKGYDINAFQAALESGKGRQRVLDDMALGNRLRISGTPTKIVNGEMIVGSSSEDFIDKYL